MSTDSTRAVEEVLATHGTREVEAFTLPPRSARYAALPARLATSHVAHNLEDQTGGTGQLWTHQSTAIEQALKGRNVVVSTGTASGKSLVFRSVAFHRLIEEPDTRAVVFYPLKALASDQLNAWQRHAAALGLPISTVGRVDGTVPVAGRLAILAESRVLVMTPDVFHAWLMSNLADSTVRQFLAHVNLVVLDEAHTLEGVFGSNFAFLFRRLRTAREFLRRGLSTRAPLQTLAATATIREPAVHLEALTGLPFTAVTEKEDGSPQHERRCIHAIDPGGPGSVAFSELLAGLCNCDHSGRVITFIDSRKGVELVAATLAEALGEQRDAVMPYRAGFEAPDRTRIEQQLRNGHLRGVVSTSALELGIDIPCLSIGVNAGVPSTRKSFRQRLGRIGRAGPGVFVVLAEEQAFRRFGSSFAEYYQRSVEPSYLYLANRFMQFAQARCLVEEMDALGVEPSKSLRANMAWPAGFETVFEAAKPGRNLPREFDAIAQMGADVPQRGYPLRNVGELNLRICLGNADEGFGEVTLAQAIRECYPGAVYYHMARPYRVYEWKTGFDARIKVGKLKGLSRTRPRIQTWANVELFSGQLLENHFMEGDLGFMAECAMQIKEQVQGFYDAGGNYRPYRELRSENPAMRPRSRMFRTTGVVINLADEWFASGSHRSDIGTALMDVFVREYSLLPQDVGMSATNISITRSQGTERQSRSIVLYDQTYGSLRLTERVYSEFVDLLTLIEHAAEEASDVTPASWREGAQRLKAFHGSLREALPGIADTSGEAGDGFMRVFSPGSFVAYRESGPLYTPVRIKEPAFDRTGTFGYRLEWAHPRAGTPTTRWIADKYLEQPGDDSEWSYCFWNPDTGEYQEGDEGEPQRPPAG